MIRARAQPAQPEPASIFDGGIRNNVSALRFDRDPFHRRSIGVEHIAHDCTRGREQKFDVVLPLAGREAEWSFPESPHESGALECEGISVAGGSIHKGEFSFGVGTRSPLFPVAILVARQRDMRPDNRLAGHGIVLLRRRPWQAVARTRERASRAPEPAAGIYCFAFASSRGSSFTSFVMRSPSWTSISSPR
jgi:hypothetical protein